MNFQLNFTKITGSLTDILQSRFSSNNVIEAAVRAIGVAKIHSMHDLLISLLSKQETEDTYAEVSILDVVKLFRSLQKRLNILRASNGSINLQMNSISTLSKQELPF